MQNLKCAEFNDAMGTQAKIILVSKLVYSLTYGLNSSKQAKVNMSILAFVLWVPFEFTKYIFFKGHPKSIRISPKLSFYDPFLCGPCYILSSLLLKMTLTMFALGCTPLGARLLMVKI